MSPVSTSGGGFLVLGEWEPFLPMRFFPFPSEYSFSLQRVRGVVSLSALRAHFCVQAGNRFGLGWGTLS